MSKKEKFYETLNNIVGAERLTNEETYIINDYVSDLEAKIRDAIAYINNNQLFEEEWDYDSNDEPFSWGCDDEIAASDLLSILRGEE